MKGFKLNTYKKHYFLAILMTTVFVLFFQNCSTQFSSTQMDNVDLQYALDLKVSDEMLYQSLLEEKSLVFWKLNKEDQLKIKNTNPIFADEFSVIAVIPSQVAGDFFEMNSGENNEVGKLSYDLSGITAEHISDLENKFKIYSEVKKLNNYIVVGAQFNSKAKNIQLVINGIKPDKNILSEGSPKNYSYLEKKIKIADSVVEVVVFNRKLSIYELASFSRQLSRLRYLNSVQIDPSIQVNTGFDTDFDFSSESNEFQNARIVLVENSCLSCHSGWSGYSELDYIENKLITPGKLTESILWTKLSATTELPIGLSEEKSQKNMPLYMPALTQDHVEVLKKWIEQAK